ncbi:MAG TPA: hypothetical protein VFG45_11740 [Candidatus Nitrosocosmicus sp.]|nr:hypothetical protein [Candidatus Nitrosocosmicus sp.]
MLAKIWKWIQKHHPKKISSKRKRISEYIVDDTLLKVGSEYIWLWVAINRARKQVKFAHFIGGQIRGKKHVCC